MAVTKTHPVKSTLKAAIDYICNPEKTDGKLLVSSFGIPRMFVWIVPGGASLRASIAMFALNFVISGIIGGFSLVWRFLTAAWYVPLTLYRLLALGRCRAVD